MTHHNIFLRTVFDKVNLYGGTMMMPLPIGRFEWVDTTLEEILSIPDNSEHGCFVEVDLITLTTYTKHTTISP